MIKNIMIKKNDLVVFILLFVVTFQSVLEQYIAFFNIFDESLSIMVFVLGICDLTKRGEKIQKVDFVFISCLFLFWIVGWIPTLLYQYQSFPVSFMSSFLSIKYFILLVGCKWYKNIPQTANLRKILIVIIDLFFIYYVSGLIFKGVHSVYAWDSCAKAIFLLALLLMVFQKDKYDYISIALLLFILATSGTTKGMGAIALFILIYFYVVKWKKKITFKEIVIGVVLLAAVGWKAIYYYYLGTRDFARSLMLQTGFRIANDYFPLGTGWGTFGSYYSGKFYSPVFYLYNLDSHRELGEATRLYICDSYWPSVLAENGWFGTSAIVVILILLFYQITKIYSINLNKYAAGLLVYIYMMITTIEESGFAQPVLMCLAIILGTLLQESTVEESCQDNEA